MKDEKMYPAALIRNLYTGSNRCGEFRSLIQGLYLDLAPWEKEADYKEQIQTVLDELYYLNMAVEEAETTLFASANSLELGTDYAEAYQKFAPFRKAVEKENDD